jgi:Helix-turn-helix domain
LGFDVAFEHVEWSAAEAGGVVARGSEMATASASELGKLVAEHVRGAAFEPARELGDRHVWRMGDQAVDVDVLAFAGELGQLTSERVEHSVRSVLQPRQDRCGERFATVLHAEHEMRVRQVDAMSAGTGSGARDGIVAGRRYRLQLTGGQQRQAARIAGCWRAVWNAALGQRRGEPSRRRPGPRTANHPAERAA